MNAIPHRYPMLLVDRVVEITPGEGIRIVERIMGRTARKQILPPRPGDQQQTRADISKAGRLLGYEPTTSLEAALAAEVDWFVGRVYGRGLEQPDGGADRRP